MGTFSPEIGLSEPTPGDPAVKNAWGTILNSNFTLIDTSIAGVLPLNVAGNSNVALTYVQGSADQSRNPQFVLTGALTGNILILWPQSVTRNFGVVNNTTGAFTVTLCVNNGSGGAAGTTKVLPQTEAGLFFSDGTNIAERLTGVVGNFTVGGTFAVPNQNVTFGQNLSVAGASFGGAAFAVGGNARITGTLSVQGDGTSQFAFLGASGDAGNSGSLTCTGFGNTGVYGPATITTNSSMTITAAGSGGVILLSGATSWTAVSDERDKIIIEPISNALDGVENIRTLIYRYKDDDISVRRIGMIAQDWRKRRPETVTVRDKDDERDQLLLALAETVTDAFACIKELKAEVLSLKAQRT